MNGIARNKNVGGMLVVASFILAAMVLTVAAQPNSRPSQPVAVAGSNGQWLIEQANRAEDARIAMHLGREALWLKNNTQVIRAGVEFVDGTIEFDVAPMDRGNFVAPVFRRASFQEHENIYLRIHRSGQFDAVQYAPRVNGSPTWQLYPEFSALAELPKDQWTHVRLEVRGPRLEVYWNNAAQPLLTVPRLRSQSPQGGIGFWARVNNDSATWAAAISNVVIRPLPSTVTATPAAVITPAPATGILTEWELAEPVPLAPGAMLRVPALRSWRTVNVEESGLVNLTRALGTFKEPTAAFAKTKLKTTTAQTVALDIGYSDEVTVFLNGAPIYSGINAFESRYPGFLGHVKLGSETVYLPLRPGENELVLATRDSDRFGWGFVARLRDPMRQSNSQP